MRLNRRTLLAAGAAAALGGAGPHVLARSGQKRQTVWTFDNLDRVGGFPLTIEGGPKLVASPWGDAVAFDGVDDALLIDDHPLAGAGRFTIEALFRPDGGAFEQRWFHLESDQSPAVSPGTGDTRILFEIRVVEGGWYLDAFATGPGYRQALMAPASLHPLGQWTHVAQTYDGEIFQSFVNGVQQAEAPIAFVPQGPGRASIGTRLNHVAYFNGAVREVRFTREALRPADFTRPAVRRG